MKRDVTENSMKGQVEKYHCIECKRLTNSEVIYNVKIDGSEEIDFGGEISWYDEYLVVRCNGCDSISFVKKSWFSEDCNPYDDGVRFTHYPSIKKKVALEIKDIPYRMSLIYEETIEAYNSGAHILVAAGLRAMIEALCSSKGINNGKVPDGNGKLIVKNNLEGKIYGLMEAGFISAKQVEALHELRFLGNIALHEIDKPTEVQARIAFSIIESIIEVIYGVEDKSKKLRLFRQNH